MISGRARRTRIKPTPYQKSFELAAGTQSRFVNFQATYKQFSLITISSVYNRNYQHRSVYDSYNTELASAKIKSVQLENASDTYSTFNTVKFDTGYANEKYLVYMQFVSRYCKGSSIVPLSNYANNPTFQELPNMKHYETLFIDLTRRRLHR